MSRVVIPGRHRLREALASASAAVLMAGAIALPAGAQQASAQDECADTSRASFCRLPDWSGADAAGIASPFGEVEGIAWLEDEIGDVPEGALDILAAGIGRVTIDDPKAVRDASDLRKLGKSKKAVPAGESLVVRIVLDGALDEVSADHASVHVATDIDGSRRNNAPSGVAAPDLPFAGSQDIYSLSWASTTGKTSLLTSNLAKGWYTVKKPFAAAWAAPDVLDLLIRPSAFGEGFRVVTHVAGDGGGYDTLSLGPAAIPRDGQVGLVPVCIEGSIAALPFVVPRLSENGQVVRDVEARASWRGGAALPIDDVARQRLDALLAEQDDDEDGRIAIPAWVNLFEDGIVIRQRADLELALTDDHALISTELGLTRRGYNVLRDFEPAATGDGAFDAWLESATDALRETMPPFRLNKRSGLLVGDAIGACIPWLEPAPEPSPEPSPAEVETTPAVSA